MEEGNEMLNCLGGVGAEVGFSECFVWIIRDIVVWNICMYYIGLECLSISTVILCMQNQCDRRCMNIFINKTALTFLACTFMSSSHVIHSFAFMMLAE